MGRSSAEEKRADTELLKKHRVVLGACLDCGKRATEILSARLACDGVLPSAKSRHYSPPTTSPLGGTQPIAIRTPQSAAINVAPSGTKRCPHCAEDIKAEAVVCRFCGRDLDSDDESDGRMQHAFQLGKCIHCGYAETWVAKYGNLCILDLSKPQKVVPRQVPTGPSCPKCSSTSITDHKREALALERHWWAGC